MLATYIITTEDTYWMIMATEECKNQSDYMPTTDNIHYV